MFDADAFSVSVLVVKHDVVNHHRPCSRSVKDLRNFLQTMSFRLWKDKESDKHNDDQETAKDDVIMPPDVVQRNGVHKGEEHQGSVDGEQFCGQALCT